MPETRWSCPGFCITPTTIDASVAIARCEETRVRAAAHYISTHRCGASGQTPSAASTHISITLKYPLAIVMVLLHCLLFDLVHALIRAIPSCVGHVSTHRSGHCYAKCLQCTAHWVVSHGVSCTQGCAPVRPGRLLAPSKRCESATVQTGAGFVGRAAGSGADQQSRPAQRTREQLSRAEQSRAAEWSTGDGNRAAEQESSAEQQRKAKRSAAHLK